MTQTTWNIKSSKSPHALEHGRFYVKVWGTWHESSVSDTTLDHAVEALREANDKTSFRTKAEVVAYVVAKDIVHDWQECLAR